MMTRVKNCYHNTESRMAKHLQGVQTAEAVDAIHWKTIAQSIVIQIPGKAMSVRGTAHCWRNQFEYTRI
jgi:hypothetical protein